MDYIIVVCVSGNWVHPGDYASSGMKNYRYCSML